MGSLAVVLQPAGQHQTWIISGCSCCSYCPSPSPTSMTRRWQLCTRNSPSKSTSPTLLIMDQNITNQQQKESTIMEQDAADCWDTRENTGERGLPGSTTRSSN